MRDTEFDDDDDEKSSPFSAVAAAMGTPAAASDDVNSSPMAALSAAMASPSETSPKDTLDDPSPFAALPSTNATGDVPAIAPTGSSADFDDDDLRPRGGIRDLIATVTSSRRNLAIVGGGLGVIIIASALVFCGGSKPTPADKPTQTAKATAPEPAPEPTPPAPTEPAPSAPANTAPTEPANAAPTEGSGENLGPTPEELAAADTTEPATEPTEPSESTQAKTRPTSTKTTKTGGTTQTKTGKTTTPKTEKTGKTVATATTTKTEPRPTGASLGGKQVVNESDGQARAGKSIAGVDQGALQKARSAYLSGNKRLFGGDAASATKHYRQALGYYPGYVAAYRGLGVAYEKLGDKANALKAFRTYLGSAPGASDAGTIKQRIAALSK